MINKLSYLTVGVAVVTTIACGRTNEAVEKRPSGEATERAVTVTNSTDTKESGSSDTAVTTKIQTKYLTDAVVKGRRINVDTKDGVVTLTGAVTSKAESDKAEELAKETEGAKSVVNNLMVETTR